MRKYYFKYIISCICIYLFLAALDIFAFKYLIEMFYTGFSKHLIIYNILFLLINPIITKIVVEKLILKSEETPK